jgi:uncharacterized protein (DUF1330 family)
MPAYWIARAKVADAEGYRRYTDRVPEIMAKYGGKILSRGAHYQTMEGPDHFRRYVLIEFDSMEAAIRCFESEEYREAAAFRRNGEGEVEITIADAGDATL